MDNGKHWGDLLPPFRQRTNHPELMGPSASNPNNNTILGGDGTGHTYDAGSDPASAVDSQGRAYFSCVTFDVASNASGLYVTQSSVASAAWLAAAVRRRRSSASQGRRPAPLLPTPKVDGPPSEGQGRRHGYRTTVAPRQPLHPRWGCWRTEGYGGPSVHSRQPRAMPVRSGPGRDPNARTLTDPILDARAPHLERQDGRSGQGCRWRSPRCAQSRWSARPRSAVLRSAETTSAPGCVSLGALR